MDAYWAACRGLIDSATLDGGRKVEVIDVGQIDLPGGVAVTEFTARLHEIVALVPPGEVAMLRVDATGEYESSDVRDRMVVVYYAHVETDAELSARVAAEDRASRLRAAIHRADVEERELAELARLRVKYDGA